MSTQNWSRQARLQRTFKITLTESNQVSLLWGNPHIIDRAPFYSIFWSIYGCSRAANHPRLFQSRIIQPDPAARHQYCCQSSSSGGALVHQLHINPHKHSYILRMQVNRTAVKTRLSDSAAPIMHSTRSRSLSISKPLKPWVYYRLGPWSLGALDNMRPHSTIK